MIQNIISYLNEYAGVFSVLLSVIAISISIISSRQTSKQVDKQIESIKDLYRSYLDSDLIKIRIEIIKNAENNKIDSEECEKIEKAYISMIKDNNHKDIDFEELKNKAKKLIKEMELHSNWRIILKDHEQQVLKKRKSLK